MRVSLGRLTLPAACTDTFTLTGTSLLRIAHWHAQHRFLTASPNNERQLFYQPLQICKSPTSSGQMAALATSSWHTQTLTPKLITVRHATKLTSTLYLYTGSSPAKPLSVLPASPQMQRCQSPQNQLPNFFLAGACSLSGSASLRCPCSPGSSCGLSCSGSSLAGLLSLDFSCSAASLIWGSDLLAAAPRPAASLLEA